MNIRQLFFIIALLFPMCSSAQTVLLINANVVDGKSRALLKNRNVLIEDGKIKTITSKKISSSDGVKVIDLNGKYIMPGMIDSHVHIKSFAAAETALHSGVTTVRSMGVSHFTDVGMRELARQGVIDSPEILAAGYHIRPAPADGFFMDEPAVAALRESEVRGPLALSKMGQVMLDRKVDWIKTTATARAGLPQTDPRQPYYDVEELKALVETGAKAGVPVAAHAHGDEGGRAAVLAGVKSIEHGTYLSDSTLKLMLEKGTYLVPTIAVVIDVTMPGGDYDHPFLQVRGRHMLPRIRETAASAYKMGVKLIAATDTAYEPDSVLRLGLELEELVKIGMTNLEAIKAATSLAATFLEVDDHTGSVMEGLDADLLVLDQNPLETIGAIHDPLMVINNGKIVVNKLEWRLGK